MRESSQENQQIIREHFQLPVSKPSSALYPINDSKTISHTINGGKKYYNHNSNNHNAYKIHINAFISNSRLIKSLPSSSFSIRKEQLLDICLSSQKSLTRIGIVFLTMQYHMKFPRYLQNKLKEICERCKRQKDNRANREYDEGKIFILVLIEEQKTKNGQIGEIDRVMGVQKIILNMCKENGSPYNYFKMVPCFGVDQARARLFDFGSEFTNKDRERRQDSRDSASEKIVGE